MTKLTVLCSNFFHAFWILDSGNEVFNLNVSGRVWIEGCGLLALDVWACARIWGFERLHVGCVNFPQEMLTIQP